MKRFKFILLLLLLSMYFLPLSAAADDPSNPNPSNPDCPTGSICLDNPLGDKKIDVPILLGRIINYAMGIIGSLALVMFIYGGAMWMLSGGNQEQVTKGKQTIIWAALGLAIIFTSYALVRFVISAIGGV